MRRFESCRGHRRTAAHRRPARVKFGVSPHMVPNNAVGMALVGREVYCPCWTKRSKRCEDPDYVSLATKGELNRPPNVHW